jgi:chromosome segregation ATPase
MRWKNFGSKPTKSLAELQTEVDKLKKARETIKNYNELQDEERRIKKEIDQEGWKLRHRKALSILNRAKIESLGIVSDVKKLSKSKTAKKYIREAMKIGD